MLGGVAGAECSAVSEEGARKGRGGGDFLSGGRCREAVLRRRWWWRKREVDVVVRELQSSRRLVIAVAPASGWLRPSPRHSQRDV